MSNLNLSDKALEESAKTASATLKELREDINFSAYNEHILIAALIIADQIKCLNGEANNISEKLDNLIESIDCAGAGAGCHVSDSETVISLSEKECIFTALVNRWILLNPSPTNAQVHAAENRFKIIAGL